MQTDQKVVHLLADDVGKHCECTGTCDLFARSKPRLQERSRVTFPNSELKIILSGGRWHPRQHKLRPPHTMPFVLAAICLLPCDLVSRYTTLARTEHVELARRYLVSGFR